MGMKKFEEYINLGIVKKQSPNKKRAESLIKEVEEKKIFLTIVLGNIEEEQINPNFIVDYCYDILMELIRAKMFLDGYNSKNSHEAEVAYMKILGFNDTEINFTDEMRYNRNGIKYYGSRLGKEYSDKVYDFMNKIYTKLINIIKSHLNGKEDDKLK